jgi:hypothetical protein
MLTYYRTNYRGLPKEGMTSGTLGAQSVETHKKANSNLEATFIAVMAVIFIVAITVASAAILLISFGK